MKRRKGKKSWKFSTLLSLFLAVAMLAGSLPLTGFEVKAAADDNTAKQSETTEKAANSGFNHPGLLRSEEHTSELQSQR